MGQELAITINVVDKSTAIDKKQSSETSAVDDNHDSKSFSSTLDEQLDKQDDIKVDKEKKELADSPEPVSEETEQAEQAEQAEQEGEESGNTLPQSEEELVESEDETVDYLLDNLIETTSSIPASTSTSPVITAENNKDADEDVDFLNALKKPVLRTDILHAIMKKEGVTSNTNLVTAKEVVISSSNLTTIATADNAQKIAKLDVGTQLGKSLFTKRNEASFSHTSNAVNSVSSALTTSSTVATQAVSTSQTSLSIQPSVQTEAWGKVLSSRVIWMAREGVQQAQLKLNPANLGPVEVKLHMSNEQVNITFTAQNALTREALEQSLPRLRESFQENGMDLAYAEVSEHDFEQKEGSEHDDGDSQTVDDHETDVEHIDNEDTRSDEPALGVNVFA
ncbi:MAG: hypothetical protein COA90_00355 [Gammaproteobacteria bacterium]|nr:MAG: hypothetical protein COA90_00355 [Gammaproteobacteria bacterium]